MNTKPLYKNLNLEVLRGYAALLVMIGHLIFWHQYFDKTYFPEKLNYVLPPAHFSVLIFFILSGYVIGINHRNRLFGSEIITYLKKRFIRLYPIYFLGVSLAIIVAINFYPINIILANFTFTQNLIAPVIWENNPAWSLNFEVFYYILFVLISFIEIKTWIAVLIFLILGFINSYLAQDPLITAYCFGYCCWLMGLLMSRNFDFDNAELKLIPLLLYILGVGNILSESKALNSNLHFLRIPDYKGLVNWYQIIINTKDLILLPFAFMIVLFFSGKTFKYAKQFFLIINIIPIYYIIHGVLRQHSENVTFYMGIVYYILSIVCYFIPFKQKRIIKWGIELGSISYAIYIIHFAILCLFGRFTIFSDGIEFYTLRVVLYFVVVVGLAFWLEKKYQPFMKRWLNKV